MFALKLKHIFCAYHILIHCMYSVQIMTEDNTMTIQTHQLEDAQKFTAINFLISSTSLTNTSIMNSIIMLQLKYMVQLLETTS